MDKVRFGIVGLGVMGSGHAGYLNSVEGATLGALCDINPETLAKLTAQYKVPGFKTHGEMFASGLIDAVIVAVPHYDHVPITLDAFRKNLHVMCEKPVAVSVKAARQVNEEYKKYPHLKFGIMFQQRTNPMFRKLREVIADGELGELTRITWIATTWFRTWTYYAMGGWRATWKGEGGGTIINQCPHNLDQLQWLTGLMPSRVTAVGAIGKTHPIEVEDEISAILEYPNGAIGHFITSTGEAPGTNRLEICGDKGKIVCENGKLMFSRNRKSAQEVNRTSPHPFVHVENWTMEIPYTPGPEAHQIVTTQFVKTILSNGKNSELLAEGTEGVRGLEIGNAILMAGLTRTPVELPVNGDAYDNFILDMTKKYGGKKNLETKTAAKVDFAASFDKK